MQSGKFITIVSSVMLLATISDTALGGKGGGKGGAGDGGGGGGSGFDTPVEYGLAIGFRDDLNDGLQSDGRIYYDGDLALDGEDPMLAAHIDASAGKNYGNLYFRTGDTLDRALYLNNSDCLSSNCMTLDDSLRNVAFTVAATESLGGGFCGMSIDQTITAPMQVTYFLPNVEKTGFVHYEPNLKGKSPCRGDNGSAEVTVERTGADTWTVRGSHACVVAPFGEPGGVAHMPFEFYVTNMSEPNCQ